jgi:hypothetical protein
MKKEVHEEGKYKPKAKNANGFKNRWVVEISICLSYQCHIAGELNYRDYCIAVDVNLYPNLL